MGKRWIALVDFIGPRDEQALDPATLDFTMKTWASGCRSCLFDRQGAAVCNRANDLALKAGLRNCESGVVYVPRVRDRRQMQIGD